MTALLQRVVSRARVSHRPAAGDARLRTSWAGLHSSRIRYEFKVRVYDFFLRWSMGAQTSGASELGETTYAASSIMDDDSESWVAEWEALGVTVEARARDSLRAGHRGSARNSLRGCTYYRAPLALVSPPEKPDEHKSRYAKARLLPGGGGSVRAAVRTGRDPVRGQDSARMHLRKATTARVLFDSYTWKAGVCTLDDMLTVASQGYVVDPSRITSPTLFLVAEQEYEQFSIRRRWQDEALATIDTSSLSRRLSEGEKEGRHALFA